MTSKAADLADESWRPNQVIVDSVLERATNPEYESQYGFETRLPAGYERRVNNPIECGICTESFAQDEIRVGACDHAYCVGCWKGYIRQAMRDGLDALSVGCPNPECSSQVSEALVLEVADADCRVRYEQAELRQVEAERNRVRGHTGAGSRG
ncbi:hypothetical protein CYMTET_32602 [Cymbomonas tetramitiformis]|uniref:RING-type domain-containing protein n=1 Tax=Cymbomonas tetramitiformis TaxID=36881 RepID=A0AAE0KS18_9CHLO|nr:hypothetical protein CYMTET_32602 [Cymbomonas tetramitiformis]